ncbi:hypothetical protein A3D06_01495 [Candidatus Roizmanbacteria bacterium RIFCSPHIGHO2_02_FULL_40_9]|uniref:RRM domain-containing protein n=2 Tax=Candidatus Roizmaniibacteriota TaxID=1752723 RepID=A0A1F7IKF6_9BACT|nr:MAG: hypothetical protein A3D06_01495 [Candidatus Roizmanbacteria bacterium RIFCSPHIGHO2_02_FULL_40_9]OGK43848.1 MAG: hypothetical protein A2957_01895 [Candidatus Roizmanbacteria bacterium RIFCSPLOWO2_01_FULL_38_11]
MQRKIEENKVFVGSLPLDLINESFKAMFAQFGKITEATIVTDRHTYQSKGFGYITFFRTGDAKKAIASMDQTIIEGKKMLVTFAKPGS